ncbi:sialic acid O-acetyltransferase [Flavobacteriaceae bacterium R38]|nr:sialic acid O-acetyltransferase [Flavobacteriaceae bacterium R38]
MCKKALIIGAGSYGEVMLTYLEEAGYHIVGFIDDDVLKTGTKIQNIPILGSFDDLIKHKFFIDFEVAFCPIGNNKARVNYLTGLQMLGYETPNFVHHSVQITKNTHLGKGCYIFPNSTLMPHTTIEDFTIISTGSSIAHHTIIGEGVLVSSGVSIGAYVTVGKKAIVGIGATVKSGPLKVGDNALIGAGSVIINDVQENCVIVGNPGKILRNREDTEIFDEETSFMA